jgi:hypothetical protein
MWMQNQDNRRGVTNWGVFWSWLFLGPLSLFFAWYSERISRKAQFVWTGVVAVQLAVVAIIVAAALNSSGLQDGSVQQFVEQNVGSSVTGTASAPTDETVTNVQAVCVQATSNTWNCAVTYNASAPAENIDQDYSASITVTCDSTGNCSYPGFIPIPSQ